MHRTFEQGKNEIAKLVEYFRTNRNGFLAPGVKEANIRKNLIDPLFEALGWDVNNKSLVAPQYREVVVEHSQDVEGHRKAPDYAFRVGPSVKFYAEVKKCGVNIKSDPAPAYQLRRYAWSGKLALSILTDFEELAVYDCTIRPHQSDNASKARIHYYTFEEYPDRWREIWDIFSREAVWGGSFDQFAQSKRGKRGSSEVDAEFLKEIEGWRDELARNIAIRNPGLCLEDLNRAVQLTIDRIVFLRMAEDRCIEIYETLLRLSDQPNIYRRFVTDLCKRADTKYNSGLFDLSADRRFNNLDVDDKVLKSILQSLYFEHGSPYEFRAMPVEILGTVYERFLVRMITLTEGHRARIEEKPEVRKAGGVYYTPAYIVDYIVKNTVGEMIEGKSPKELRGQGRGERRGAKGDAQPFRVLDMACGSGSFLLGAYQCLLDHYLKWYVENDPSKHKGAVWEVGSGTQGEKKQALRHAGQREKAGLTWKRDASATQDLFPSVVAQLPSSGASAGNPASPLVAQPASGGMVIRENAAKWRTRSRQPRDTADAASPDSRPPEWRLTIPEKKRILTTHVFGVDIDPQAVEVAKLSLLLKVLEGEDEQTLGPQIDLFPGSTDRALPNLDQNIKCGNSLIGPDYFAGQIVCDPDEMKRINPFDWNAEFPGAMKAGGFDCVIGNPPYGSNFAPEESTFLERDLPVFAAITDAYVAFIEKAHSNLLDRGRFGYIVPSAWLGGPRYRKLREYLLRYSIETVISLPFDVFADAYIDTLIVTTSKQPPAKSHRVITYEYPKKERIASIATKELRTSRIPQREWARDADVKFVLDISLQRIIASLRRRSTARIGQYVEMKRGVLFSPELLTRKKSGKNSYPYFEGDVYRYTLNHVADNWVEYGSKMKEYPKEFHWFTGERILLRRLVNRQRRLMATRIADTVITNKNLYVLKTVPGVSLEFLLGILNSRLISRLYLAQVSQATKDDFPQVTIKDILALPAPVLDRTDSKALSKHRKIGQLVESMLDLHRHLAAAKSQADTRVLQRQIDHTDREIDRLVYDLYGLTDEEIAIVEEP